MTQSLITFRMRLAAVRPAPSFRRVRADLADRHFARTHRVPTKASAQSTDFDPHYGLTKDSRESDIMIRIEGDFDKDDEDALLHEFAYCGDATGIAFEGDLVFIEFGTPAEARQAVEHGNGKSLKGKSMRVVACSRDSCHIEHNI